MKNKIRLFSATPLIKGSGGNAKYERQGRFTAYNNGMLVTGFPALHPNCQGFGGRAIVSVHLRSVSTPSLRSVGHSPQVHGTQAQIYLATSPYLNVVCNVCAKTEDKIQKAICAKNNATHRGWQNQLRKEPKCLTPKKSLKKKSNLTVL